MAANDNMLLADVPGYVFGKTGVRVTLQSIYNWVNHGVGGETLRVIMGRGTSKFAAKFQPVRFTTSAWVDDFLSRVQELSGR